MRVKNWLTTLLTHPLIYHWVTWSGSMFLRLSSGSKIPLHLVLGIEYCLSCCYVEWEMLHISLSLMNRLNKTKSAIFSFGLVTVEGSTFTFYLSLAFHDTLYFKGVFTWCWAENILLCLYEYISSEIAIHYYINHLTVNKIKLGNKIIVCLHYHSYYLFLIKSLYAISNNVWILWEIIRNVTMS